MTAGQRGRQKRYQEGSTDGTGWAGSWQVNGQNGFGPWIWDWMCGWGGEEGSKDGTDSRLDLGGEAVREPGLLRRYCTSLSTSPGLVVPGRNGEILVGRGSGIDTCQPWGQESQGLRHQLAEGLQPVCFRGAYNGAKEAWAPFVGFFCVRPPSVLKTHLLIRDRGQTQG